MTDDSGTIGDGSGRTRTVPNRPTVTSEQYIFKTYPGFVFFKVPAVIGTASAEPFFRTVSAGLISFGKVCAVELEPVFPDIRK